MEVAVVLIALLVLVLLVLLFGLLVMVTFNNSIGKLYKIPKKLTYGNAIAFFFFVAVIGTAFFAGAGGMALNRNRMMLMKAPMQSHE